MLQLLPELSAESELTDTDSKRPRGKQHKLYSCFLVARSGVH